MSIQIDDRVHLTDPRCYGPEIPEHRPFCIVLHHDGSAGEEGTINWLSHWHPDPVSTHKYIRRSGVIVKIVAEHMQAWHAGWSRWGGRDGCNSGLGYEIANTGLGTEAYTAEQYEAVALSVAYDTALYHIPDSMVTSHRRCADEWVIAHPWLAKLKGILLGRKNDARAWDWVRMWKRVDQIRASWPPEFGIVLWFSNTGVRVTST